MTRLFDIYSTLETKVNGERMIRFSKLFVHFSHLVSLLFFKCSQIVMTVHGFVTVCRHDPDPSWTIGDVVGNSPIGLNIYIH